VPLRRPDASNNAVGIKACNPAADRQRARCVSPGWPRAATVQPKQGLGRHGRPNEMSEVLIFLALTVAGGAGYRLGPGSSTKRADPDTPNIRTEVVPVASRASHPPHVAHHAAVAIWVNYRLPSDAAVIRPVARLDKVLANGLPKAPIGAVLSPLKARPADGVAAVLDQAWRQAQRPGGVADGGVVDALDDDRVISSHD